jgi:cytochrome c553
MFALRVVAGRGAFGLGCLALLMAGPVSAAGNAAAGKAKSAQCVACHGPGGSPSPAMPFPALAGQDSDYLLKQLRDFKSGKRENPVMQNEAKRLSDQDMQDLAAYFVTVTPRVVGAANAELVKKGQRIYRGGVAKSGVSACMSCHGPAGHGIPPRFPRVAGQTGAYIEQQLLAFKEAKRSNDAEVMARIAARMSNAEIKAVAEYIAGLR